MSRPIQRLSAARRVGAVVVVAALFAAPASAQGNGNSSDHDLLAIET